MRIAILVMFAVGTAQADRLAAEQLEKKGKQTGDLATYDACGKAYLDLYNADPQAPGADEALYNAAVCFEEGRSAGAAITTFELLRSAVPRSKMMRHTTGRLARLYETAGRLATAANLYAEYAMKYPAEKDAMHALSDAIVLRAALGDDERQVTETRYFAKTFGAKQPRETAEVMLALTPVYERKGTDVALVHLRDVLRVYAGRDPRLRAQVLVRRGELAWNASCPRPIDGLCVKQVRERPLPLAKPPIATGVRTQCAATARRSTVVVPRNAALVKEALAAVAEARKILVQIAATDDASRSLDARAQLVQADREVEAFLAVGFPANLDFSPDKPKQREGSIKRFQAYLEQSKQLSTAARKRYEEILQQRDVVGSLAATSRLGLLPQHTAEQLQSAVIPQSIRGGAYAADKVEAFCSVIDSTAEPLLALARSAYELCLTKASELGAAVAWQTLCERELAILAPKLVPSIEMLPAPRLALAVRAAPPVKPGTHHSAAFTELVERYGKSAGCASIGGKLEQLAKHEKLADAFYMAGLEYERCGKREDAKRVYERAQLPAARVNLGRLAWLDGKHEVARKHWQGALAANGKLATAHVNLAIAELRDRAVDAAKHRAYSAAVIDPDDPLPHAVLALIERSPVLAKHHAAMARRLDDKSPATGFALGITLEARPWLDLAKTAGTDEAYLASARLHAKLRRWADARQDLDRVTEKTYELAVLRGVTTHGLRDYAKAEAAYTEAIALDAKRPEAHFNLGELWKASAVRATDPAAAKALLRKAADSYRRSGVSEGVLFAADCDKAIAAL